MYSTCTSACTCSTCSHYFRTIFVSRKLIEILIQTLSPPIPSLWVGFSHSLGEHRHRMTSGIMGNNDKMRNRGRGFQSGTGVKWKGRPRTRRRSREEDAEVETEEEDGMVEEGERRKEEWGSFTKESLRDLFMQLRVEFKTNLKSKIKEERLSAPAAVRVNR